MAEKCSDQLTQHKDAITAYLKEMDPEGTVNTPAATFNKCQAGVDYESVDSFEKLNSATIPLLDEVESKFEELSLTEKLAAATAAVSNIPLLVATAGVAVAEGFDTSRQDAFSQATAMGSYISAAEALIEKNPDADCPKLPDDAAAKHVASYLGALASHNAAAIADDPACSDTPTGKAAADQVAAEEAQAAQQKECAAASTEIKRDPLRIDGFGKVSKQTRCPWSRSPCCRSKNPRHCGTIL